VRFVVPAETFPVKVVFPVAVSIVTLSALPLSTSLIYIVPPASKYALA